jgi:hypothetical protein
MPHPLPLANPCSVQRQLSGDRQSLFHLPKNLEEVEKKMQELTKKLEKGKD